MSTGTRAVGGDREPVPEAAPLREPESAATTSLASPALEVDNPAPVATYEVEVTRKPFGFFFDGNSVLAVNKYGAAHGLIHPHSEILAVDDEPVDASSFAEAYAAADAPVRLRMTMPAAKAGGSTPTADAEVEELTKETLTGLILIYFSVFMDFFGALVVVPLLPFLAKEFDIGSVELALMTTVYQLATVPAAFIVAKITSLYGTRYGILYSIFGTSVSVALQGLAGSYEALLAARVFGGLTGSSIPVAMTFIGMRVPKKDKPQYMSYIGVALTSVVIFAPLVSGALSSYGIGWPFVFGAIFAGVGGLWAVAVLPNAKVPRNSKAKDGSLHQPLAQPNGMARDKTDGSASGCQSLSKPLWALLLIEFLRTLPFSAFASLNGLFMMEKFGLAAQDYGMLVASHGGVLAINTVLVYKRVYARLGGYQVMTVGALLQAVGFALLPFTEKWWAYMAVLSPLVGMGSSWASNAINPVTDEWVTNNNRPFVNAAKSVSNSISFAVGPVFFGWLYDTLKASPSVVFDRAILNFFWWAASLVCLVLAVLNLSLSKLMFAPLLKKKEDETKDRSRQEELEKKAQLLTRVTSKNVTQDVAPTEEEMLEFGRFALTMLANRNYAFRTHAHYVRC